MRELVGGLALGALILASCGGDSDDGGAGGGGTTIPLEDLPARIVGLECDLIMQCGGDAIAIYMAGFDCETQFGREFEDGEWPNTLDAVEEGRIVYHADKAQACLDAWKAQGCDILVNRAPDACEQAMEGTVEEGGDCTLHAECKGPLYCKSDNGCPGTCSPRESAGADCTTSEACEDGLACDETVRRCVAPRQAGEPCQGGQPECLLGLMCDGSEDGQPGTCKEASEMFKLGEGESCEIEGTLCELGLSCVVEGWEASGAIASCKPMASSGGACGIGLPNQCPAGQYCDADPQTTGQWTGTCVSLPKDGESCVDLYDSSYCAAYHVCDSGNTCREVQRLDGACSSNEECYSGNCSGGTCKATNSCSQP